MMKTHKGKDVEMQRMINFQINKTLYSLILLALMGCSVSDISDLTMYVEETRNAQKGRIEPLPQFKPFGLYEYNANRYRDPFTQWVDASQSHESVKRVSKGPQPNFNRRKELLEKFPLDALRMVGILSRNEGRWAIVKAPDGMVYRVQKGNYMGQNHGKIIVLKEEGLSLTELLPDGLGGWQERAAALILEN